MGPNKNRINRRKHGLSFETAKLVFEDPFMAQRPGPNSDEDRWHTIGVIGNMAVMVAHTWSRPEHGTGTEVGASSAPGNPRRMKGEPMKKETSRELTKQQKVETGALAGLPDEETDTSDVPEILDWFGAKRGLLYRPVKQQITLRLDADVVAWFRANAPGGRGYQTEINRVLREHAKLASNQT